MCITILKQSYTKITQNTKRQQRIKNPNTITTLNRKFKNDFFDFAKLDFAYLISLSIFFLERSILATNNKVDKIKTKSIKIIFPMN